MASFAAPGCAAGDLVRAVVDQGSWQPWEGTLPADETVITGTARVAGHRVALLVSDFTFLGGSVGIAAAGRLARGIEEATRQRLPLVALPASGGTRMQEGTPAFLAMIDIVRLLAEHRAAGLAYLVYLRNPTTGGTLASWGSLGQITFAEPGALIGFLGPRVHELLEPGALPRSTQRAENLAAQGVVDAVVATTELRSALTAVLAALAPSSAHDSAVTSDGHSHPTEPLEKSGWNSVVRTRDPARSGVRQLLDVMSRHTVYLSGGEASEPERAMLLALANVGGRPCVVVAHDRASHRLPGPGGLRIARRGMRLAAELRLPLLTVIDAAGAELSPSAEEGGLAGEIACCLADLVTLPSPTLSVLLGQGGGGTALALLPADRTIAASNAWLAPLPPEAASALVYRDLSHAADIADTQHITSGDLLAVRVVDRVVDEAPDGAHNHASFLRRLGNAVSYELAEVTAMNAAARLAARRSRYQHLARPA